MNFKDFDTTIEDLISATCNVATNIESILLTESLGRVLARDIVAKENSPAHLTSEMDGYAFRYKDQEKGLLKLCDRLPAGSDLSTKVDEGTCVKTFTGSLMSEGSDTLIPIENVEVNNDEVKIITPVKQGFAIRAIGENYKENEVLIKKGTTIGYAQIGVMAELGEVNVAVFEKPRIAVLATGSEILEIGEPKISPAKIRSSNHVTLQALMMQHGASVSRLPIVKDEKEEIKKSITNALKNHDIIITTGGVSVGDFDFVKEIIKGLEPEYIVDGAFVKPGRHIKIVKVGQKFIFALPGFPYSSTVMACVYVLPLLRAMQGKEPKSKYIEARLLEDYPKRSKFTEFTACNLKIIDGQFCVDLEGKRLGSSAILTNMLDNAALLRIEKDTCNLKKGEKVRILPIDFKFFG
ncbi:MAG: molybdopterin molybdotransferase MoeA [Sulfurospirillum sp.]|nr:molybdopterin molybdotransferase MoeA [Sulfurospirillum sp.]